MKKIKGFTLVELVIVVTLIVILSTISVPLYKGHANKARALEGYALLKSIRDAELLYKQEYSTWYAGNYSDRYGGTCFHEILGIDARGNKYFTFFRFIGEVNLSAFASANGLVLSMIYNKTLGTEFK